MGKFSSLVVGLLVRINLPPERVMFFLGGIKYTFPGSTVVLFFTSSTGREVFFPRSSAI